MWSDEMVAIFIISGVVLLFILLYVLVLIRTYPREPHDKRVLCDYAHRGLHSDCVPENSLAAFELAAKSGYGIELDVQLSRDGEVMVFHDYKLLRMTGREENLSMLDTAELDVLRLNGSDEKIPRLSEVLDIVNGRVPILIELKGESVNSELCPKLADVLKDYNGPYCFESFNPILLGKMAKLMPHIWRGLLYSNLCRNDKRYTPVDIAVSTMALNIIAKPNFIAYDQKYRDNFALKLVSVYRAASFSWTHKSIEEYRVAKEKGEYSIFEGFCAK